MSARTPSLNPTTLVSASGTVLTLALYFLVSPQAAVVAAMASLAAVLVLNLNGPSAVSGSTFSSDSFENLLKELKTIPALAPQVRVEINTQSPALKDLMASLPAPSRTAALAFLDRAVTRRTREAEATSGQAASVHAQPTPIASQVTSIPSPVQPVAKPAAPASAGSAQAAGIHIDAILIDDEESVHLAWKVAAGRAGKTVLTFKSVDDILALPGLSKIPVDTRIIVDAQLAQGTKGVIAAKALFDKGFKNLALAHPEPRKIMEPMPTWILQVTDKRPQFL